MDLRKDYLFMYKLPANVNKSFLPRVLQLKKSNTKSIVVVLISTKKGKAISFNKKDSLQSVCVKGEKEKSKLKEIIIHGLGPEKYGYILTTGT